MAKRLHGQWRLRVHQRYAPLIKALRAAGDKTATYKPALKRFAVQYAKEIDQRFAATEGAKGVDWPEWSEDYARRTESRALGVLSGKMSDTLSNASRGILSLGHFRLVYGMKNAPYSVAFNFGRKGKSKQRHGKIPRRDIMGGDRELNQKVQGLLARHQAQIMSRAFKRFGLQ